MCGIVGMITAEPGTVGWLDRRKFMEQALIIDTLRGDDSTGVFYQGHKGAGTAGYFKSVQDGYDFVNNAKFQSLAKDMEKYWFMAGHNRAATVGSMDVEGAHPFQEGPITLIHNGTLRTTYGLPIPLSRIEGVDVDSHALCHNLANVGTRYEDLQSVIEKIDGAFALVWHDARDDSLNIIRNDDRPLHIAESGASKTLYFASEAMQLAYMNVRLGLRLKDIMFPEPGVHLKFKEGSLVPEVATFDVSPKYNIYTGYDRPPMNHYGGHCYDYDEDDYHNWWLNQGSASGKPQPQQEDNRVLVGGRKREIPQLSQELLLKENLVIEDRLLFTPMAKHAKKGGFAFVVGHLDSVGLPAVLYHMELNAAEKAFDRRWLVRPVAINMPDPEKREAIVVCKLVSTVAMRSDEKWNALAPGAAGSTNSGSAGALPPPNQPSTEDYEDDEPETIGGIRGPYNRYYSLAEWRDLHQDGCAFCSDDLHPEFAKDMMWYDDEYPLCPVCTLEQRWNDDDLTQDLPW